MKQPVTSLPVGPFFEAIREWDADVERLRAEVFAQPGELPPGRYMVVNADAWRIFEEVMKDEGF